MLFFVKHLININYYRIIDRITSALPSHKALKWIKVCMNLLPCLNLVETIILEIPVW